MSEHSNTPPHGPPDKPQGPGEHGPPPGSYQVGTGASYRLDRFVVTGVKGDIDALIASARVDDPTGPISNLPRAPIEEIPPPGAPTPLAPGSVFEGLVTRVYLLPDSVGLVEMIEAFYVQASSRQPFGYSVFAEPDYLTGASQGACIEGGPAVPPQSTSGRGKVAFDDQWAFNPTDGINLHDLDDEDLKGGPVCVAVFDTSPFDNEGQQSIDWLDTDWKLTVHHPPDLPNLYSEDCAIPLQHGPHMAGRYSDHGLFVSGLAHHVAPPSRIHLIRVLNEYNLGDAFFLVKALWEFLLKPDRILKNYPLNRTVVNLSLGVVEKPDPERKLRDNVRTWISDLLKVLPPGSPLATALVEALAADGFLGVNLYFWLKAASEAGAIIVACAGNGSTLDDVKDAEAPARYPFVIGVAGHNNNGDRSCFSNRGNISAPAGDFTSGGDPVHWVGNSPTGAPGYDATHRYERWAETDWLIGLSKKLYPPGPSPRHQGYMAWMGTSFAAPLVAGGAARLLLTRVIPGDVRSDIGALPALAPSVGLPPPFQVP